MFCDRILLKLCPWTVRARYSQIFICSKQQVRNRNVASVSENNVKYFNTLAPFITDIIVTV